MNELYESLITLLKNNSKYTNQHEQLLNKIPFFQFYKSIFKTDSFTFSALKFIQMIYLKKGQVLKHQGDNVDNIVILLQGTLSLMKVEQKKQKAIYRLQPGEHLFQAELYKNVTLSKYQIIAITDCIAITLSFNIIHEICVYGFQYAKYKEEFDYFMIQFPDVKPLELIPFIKKVRKEFILNNTKIYNTKQIANKVYFIISGEVEIYAQNEDGKLQRMTVACDNDSFGEEALLQKTYKYTTRTQYYKKTILYVFEIDDFTQTYAPNIIKLLDQKLQLKENHILQKIKQTQTQNNTLPTIVDEKLKKPFEQFLHITSPRAKSIKIHRASSMNDGGLFNFMELNNPGKNPYRLFEQKVNRQLIKEQFERRDRNKSLELQKYWNVAQN